MKSRHLHRCTLRYPRSLAEAFPHTAEHANPFHAPSRKRSLGKWVAWSVFGALCLALIARGV